MSKTSVNSRTLISGEVVYSRIPIDLAHPGIGGRLFAVKSADSIGNLIVWPLSSASEIAQYGSAIQIKPDKTNCLHKLSAMVLDIEVELSAAWPVVRQPGTIGEQMLRRAVQTQELYNKENAVRVIRADEPLEKDERDMRDKIKDLYQGFVKDPSVYLDYLQFSGQFYRYSPRNRLLIYLQNSKSSFVASKWKWQQLGYSIRPKDEKRSMTIYRPGEKNYFNKNGYLIPVHEAAPEDKLLIASGALPVIKKQHFYESLVWDISQTTCPASEYPRVFDRGHKDIAHRQLFSAIKELAELEGISVTTEDMRSISLSGFYRPNDNTIHLNENENDTKAAVTLCHEYAHALLHNTKSPQVSHPVEEFEAQSLAIVLMSSYGLPIDYSAKDYMVDYLKQAQAQDDFRFDTSVQRISKQMRHVEERLSDFLVQQPSLEQKQEIAHAVEQNLMTKL